MKQVTIQGEPGCFHEEAARRYFGDEPIEIVPCRTFEAQFERMRHEGSLLGIVAIENTIAGSLLQNHELLRRSESQIIGECKLRIVADDAEKAAELLKNAVGEAAITVNGHAIEISVGAERSAELNKLLVQNGVAVSALYVTTDGLEKYFIERVGG